MATKKKQRIKPRKPKARKLTVKQRAFIAAKIAAPGISDREAARRAGYTDRTAGHADRDIVAKAAVRAAFRTLFDQAVTDQQLVDIIAAGLSAVETEFAKCEGRITDSVDVIALVGAPRLCGTGMPVERATNRHR